MARSQEWALTLDRARDRLLSGDGVAPHAGGPREEIVASWRRSLDEGAAAEEIRSPYDANLNLTTRLVRAGAPVIQQVQEDVMGSPMTVVLADSRGKVLLRASGESQLESALDRVMLAPGFTYAEKYVGTNGIGTALEGRTTSLVHGNEHFNSALRAYACVGVPLRDPNTRRIVGVLDITTWSGLANPALTALVRQAGRVIEEGLLELSGSGARALMEEYLHASRSRGDRVLAVSAEALLATPAAASLLGDMRREDLWPLAQDALASSPRSVVPLLRPDDSHTSLHMTAVSREGSLVGAIIEITEEREPAALAVPSCHPTRIAGLVGLSPATMGAALLVSRQAAERLAVCVVGEPGVGKEVTVRAVASQHFPHRNLVVIDPLTTPLAGDEVISSALGNLAHGSPVLVKHAEALPPGALSTLLSAATAGSGTLTGWLALSLRSSNDGETDPTADVLRGAGVLLAAVPPLRARSQDLDKIVPAMARRHAGRELAVTPALVSRLMREPWPGNLTEIDALVRTMVAEAQNDVLDVKDLPEDLRTTHRRQLTAMEWMTREAIVTALRTHDGDKARAARSLGMSRASIYRKIKSLDIREGEHRQGS